MSSIPMRILIAEDETIIRLDLRDLLEKSGFEVVAEARDGEEAVALARSEAPDLALLDVKMPKLDGIDAARRILDEHPIPIVMVTAYGEQELVARAVENAYLGRVFAVAGVLASAGMLLGAAVGGALGERVGIVNLLTLQGLGYVVAGSLAGVLLRREPDPLVVAERRADAIP